MKLTITQQDINKANKLCGGDDYFICECCPTAVAAKRQNLITNPCVGYTGARDLTNGKQFELSKELQEQVRLFTIFREFKPGDYEITPIS